MFFVVPFDVAVVVGSAVVDVTTSLLFDVVQPMIRFFLLLLVRREQKSRTKLLPFCRLMFFFSRRPFDRKSERNKQPASWEQKKSSLMHDSCVVVEERA